MFMVAFSKIEQWNYCRLHDLFLISIHSTIKNT